MKVCFTNPVTGEEVCFYIPILVRRWPRELPRGIETLRPNPEPDPWLTGAGISSQLIQDLQTLASIHALSAGLSKGLQETVQNTVRSHVRELALPEGLKVSF